MLGAPENSWKVWAPWLVEDQKHGGEFEQPHLACVQLSANASQEAHVLYFAYSECFASLPGLRSKP